jgi:4-hydroxy-3-methylbut-2-en-1-yl diphosphate synthase IspG/GcpE
MVHEVEHTEKVMVGDASQVDEWMRVGMNPGLLPKHLLEEVRACTQDDLVSLERLRA